MARSKLPISGPDVAAFNLLPWITKFVMLAGPAGGIALIWGAEKKLVTGIVVLVVFFVLLNLIALIDGALEKRLKRRLAEGGFVPEPESDRVHEENETTRPAEDAAPKTEGFPTFHPDEIEFDTELDEGDYEEDTLYDDTTGHGVDMEHGLISEGIGAALDMLEWPESDWSITPWGCEVMLAIEAVAAASGAPSQSRQLGHVRSWGRRVIYQPSPKVVQRMLERIDYYLAEVRKDPEGRQVNPDYLEDVEAAGELMRARIASLACETE